LLLQVNYCFAFAMIFTHKRKTIEDYFDNTHSKKARTYVQNVINDEKKIEDTKNRDRNIHFY